MNGPAITKYALYGVLGAELSLVGVGVMDRPLWFFGILITVFAIETLGIIQSRRY